MWGESTWGQLGVPVDTVCNHQLLPIPVPVGKEECLTMVACGGTHTVCLTKDNVVYAWGRGDSGQLGIGRSWFSNTGPGATGMDTPQRIVSLDEKKVVQIACGAFHSAAVTCDGKLFTWGKEDYGMLGVGYTSDKHVPTAVDVGIEKIKSVSLGGWHTTSVTESGKCFVFGRNEYARLGLQDSRSRVKPAMLCDFNDMEYTAAGGTHTLFISSSGHAYSAGRVGYVTYIFTFH